MDDTEDMFEQKMEKRLCLYSEKSITNPTIAKTTIDRKAKRKLEAEIFNKSGNHSQTLEKCKTSKLWIDKNKTIIFFFCSCINLILLSSLFYSVVLRMVVTVLGRF